MGMETNTKTALELAATLGLKAYIESGRLKVEGPAAELVRFWAVQGLDVVRDHDGARTRSWSVRKDGQHHASILKDKETLFGYSYTAI